MVRRRLRVQVPPLRGLHLQPGQRRHPAREDEAQGGGEEGQEGGRRGRLEGGEGGVQGVRAADAEDGERHQGTPDEDARNVHRGVHGEVLQQLTAKRM